MHFSKPAILVFILKFYSEFKKGWLPFYFLHKESHLLCEALPYGPRLIGGLERRGIWRERKENKLRVQKKKEKGRGRSQRPCDGR